METENKYFETDKPDEILSAEILEFAHGYQSNDFPNPDRKNCPPREELLKIADSAELPKAALREHLLGCSPCFLEFHAARQAGNAAPVTAETGVANPKSSWFAFFLRPVPFTAMLFFLCALAGILLYSLFNRTNTEIAETKNVEQSKPVSENQSAVSNEASLPAENSETALTQPPKPTTPAVNSQNRNSRNRVKEESKRTTKKQIRLDLAAAAILRNKNSSEVVYALPSAPVALSVKLPAGSPAGDYEVSLLDETGKTLVKNPTTKSRGKNLRVELNLRNNRGRARLCIAPKGEIPDCFAVFIGRDE